MGEGLLTRAYRVVEAGVSSVVEGAERLTGPALMRQAVRDVQHAADDLRGKERRARRTATQAAEQGRVATARAEALLEEARYALQIGARIWPRRR
jgi:phage shock protein A